MELSGQKTCTDLTLTSREEINLMEWNDIKTWVNSNPNLQGGNNLKELNGQKMCADLTLTSGV